MENYNYSTTPLSVDTYVSSVMKRVYLKMTLGLVVSALVAMFCAGSVGYLQFIANNSWAMWVLLFAELGLVIGISGGINKLSSATASALFYIYAVVNGLVLAPIFIVFTGVSIAKTFFITAGTFGGMCAYGYLTSRDLSRFGSFMFMALIGIIIASLVNIFLHSSTMDWIISIAGVAIFIGLTAWDTQQIKRMAALNPSFSTGRIATQGALTLYLDFINLFLYLLRFFGSSRD
jgi:hypothetical protein